MKLIYYIQLIVVLYSLPVSAQKPVKVDSVTITFTNPTVGFQAQLTGLLQWPETPGKHPLIVFIHGSGMGTRYEYSNMFSVLLAKGYAIFSYDKRGVKQSGGTYNGVGPKNSPMMIPLLASDANEGIDAVKSRLEIDSNRIILIGASQAGWIIPVVAFLNNLVTHYIIMYGPTVSVGQEIYYSRFGENGTMNAKQAENMLKGYKGIWGFDPLPYLAKIKQKGLWLYGGRDVSIPTKRSIHLLDSLNAISKKPITIKLYPNAGHGLIIKETGKFEDYQPVIMNWLDKNVKKSH